MSVRGDPVSALLLGASSSVDKRHFLDKPHGHEKFRLQHPKITPSAFNHNAPDDVKHAVDEYKQTLGAPKFLTWEQECRRQAILDHKEGDKMPILLPTLTLKEQDGTAILDSAKPSVAKATHEEVEAELQRVNVGQVPTDLEDELEQSHPLLRIEPLNKNMSKDKIPKMPFGELVGFHPFRSYMIGPPHTGKSVLLTNLIVKHFKPYFDRIFLWSPTATIDDTWKNVLDKKNIYKDVDLRTLEDAMARTIREIESKGGVHKVKRVLFVFDDEAANDELLHSHIMRTLAVMNRHVGTSVMVSAQKYNMVPKVSRTTASIMFLFAVNNESELDTIAEEQTGPLLTRKQFKRMYRGVTSKPYHFLTVNHQTKNKTEMFRDNLDVILRLDPAALEEDSLPLAQKRKRKREREEDEEYLADARAEDDDKKTQVKEANGSTAAAASREPVDPVDPADRSKSKIDKASTPPKKRRRRKPPPTADD